MTTFKSTPSPSLTFLRKIYAALRATGLQFTATSRWDINGQVSNLRITLNGDEVSEAGLNMLTALGFVESSDRGRYLLRLNPSLNNLTEEMLEPTQYHPKKESDDEPEDTSVTYEKRMRKARKALRKVAKLAEVETVSVQRLLTGPVDMNATDIHNSSVEVSHCVVPVAYALNYAGIHQFDLAVLTSISAQPFGYANADHIQYSRDLTDGVLEGLTVFRTKVKEFSDTRIVKLLSLIWETLAQWIYERDEKLYHKIDGILHL